MGSKYYVAVRPQTNEYHAVHKEDCPFLPEEEKRICLGMFNTDQDAVREGQRHFPRAISCRFCSKEHMAQNKKPVVNEMLVAGNFITSDQLKITWDSALQSSVN